MAEASSPDPSSEAQHQTEEAPNHHVNANTGNGENKGGKEASIKTFGWTDEVFEEFIRQELNKDPLHEQYPEIFDAAPGCITKWRSRYRGDRSTWNRIFEKDRVVKETIEAVPIIDSVQRLVMSSSSTDDKKYTIIDLASGKGYLSMLLSELLPPSQVKRFVLIDKAWPQHNEPPKPHHISCTHIQGDYFEKWPIPLYVSKQDLKHRNQRKNIQERYLTEEDSPVILLGVHLCGTLSIKAVEFFNENPNICFFCLKPCCLPGMVHAKRHEVFELGRHKFDAKDVCMAGKWKKNRWHGPPRTELRKYFERWSEHLFQGIDTEHDDAPAKKIQKRIMVQTGGGFQNEFLFAERKPKTDAVWEVLLHDSNEMKEEDDSNNTGTEDSNIKPKDAVAIQQDT